MFGVVPLRLITSKDFILMISGLFLQLSFHKLTEWTGEGDLCCEHIHNIPNNKM